MLSSVMHMRISTHGEGQGSLYNRRELFPCGPPLLAVILLLSAWAVVTQGVNATNDSDILYDYCPRVLASAVVDRCAASL